MVSARTRVATLSVLLVAVAMCALFAPAAEATVYTVTMKNLVVLMTEFGNRVALPAAEIDSVAVDSESRGFGHQLNNTTMALGWAPNDGMDMDSDEGKAYLASEAAAAAAASQAQPVYNQQQFVDLSQLTGMPTWMTGINSVPQVQPVVVRPPSQQ